MKQVRLFWRSVLAACLLAIVLGGVSAQGNALAALPARHGWVQVNQSGFGNPNNRFVGSMAVYKGDLYAGITNRVEGGSVWRYSGGTTWEVVAAPGQISSTANPAMVSMIVFRDSQDREMLYVATAWSSLTPDKFSYQVWRYDGAQWELVLVEGSPIHGYTAFEVFNNELYVGVQYPSGANTGSKILKSGTGNPGSWTPVVVNGNTGGTNHPSAFGITSLKTFGSYLYASVADLVNGVQVWRTANGTSWSTVVDNGFGISSQEDPGGLTVFNSNLYLGVQNQTGGRLYRTQNGTTWQAVVQDGFGNLANEKIEGMAVFENVAYAMTYNTPQGMEVWMSDSGTSWTPVMKGGFGSSHNRNSLWNSAHAVYDGRLYIGTSNYDTTKGGQIWMMVDNVTYMPVLTR